MRTKRALAARRFAPLGVATILLSGVAHPALGQDTSYPNRTIRIVQPSAAGGPSDVLIRVIAAELSARVGQPVVVENRPGAGGVIGAEGVANAPADGYTLLSVGNFLFTTAALRKKMPYDAIKDFTGVSLLSTAPLVLVANPNLAASTVADVVDLAKKSPTGLLYTSPNFGGVPYLSGQLLMRAADIKLQHVDYSGSPAALIDVMAGRVPLMFDLWSSSKPYVEEGKLKVIAAVTQSPLADAPQVPLLRSVYPVFDFSLNNAVIVSAKTPRPIVDKLTTLLHEIVGKPDVRARMAAFGLQPRTSTSDEYNAMAEKELVKWRDLARANNIVLE